MGSLVLQSEFRFSTESIPESERLPAWQESMGRNLLRINSVPLIIPVEGKCLVRQHEQELSLSPGEGVFARSDQPLMFGAKENYRVVNATLPVRAFELLVGKRDGLSFTVVRAGQGVIKLLHSYVELVCSQTLLDPAACQLAEAHIQDLAALAFGADREAAAIAEGRGLRAARIAAIKQDIAQHLGRADLSVSSVAKRQGISPVYLRKLLDSEGTSYSELVRGWRLARAHRLLCDPAMGSKTITDIALHVGFSDLSYFNRCFRRRFGASPREVRAVAGSSGHRAS